MSEAMNKQHVVRHLEFVSIPGYITLYCIVQYGEVKQLAQYSVPNTPESLSAIRGRTLMAFHCPDEIHPELRNGLEVANYTTRHYIKTATEDTPT